jgi:hypothetical protein
MVGRFRIPGRETLYRVLLVCAVLLIGVVGCAKDEAPAEQAAADEPGTIAGQLPPADVTSQPGDAMIEDPGQVFPVEGLYLNPYLDDAGTKTELAVKPGEPFQLNIFGETVEPYSTNAIQYRIALPAGVILMGTNEFEHKSVSTGDPQTNYMLAYDCQPAGRFRLATYFCRVDENVTGGEVRLLEGLPASGINFIGFVSCEFVELRATGGTATLTLKK